MIKDTFIQYGFPENISGKFTIPMVIAIILSIWFFTRILNFGLALAITFIIFGLFAVVLMHKARHQDIEKIFKAFEELQNTEPNPISLKQREILLWEMAIKSGYTRLSDDKKESLLYDVGYICGKEIYLNKELENIKNLQNNLPEKDTSNVKEIFEKNLIDLYENFLERKFEYQNTEYENSIQKYLQSQARKKYFFVGIIVACILLFISGKYGWIYDYEKMVIIFIFFVLFWHYLYAMNESQKYDFSLGNSFAILQESVENFFEIISKNQKNHYDFLLFADFIDLINTNILNRNKNISENEKFLEKIHNFYIFKMKIPEDVTNFFLEEKMELKNDSLWTLDIIEEWIELEKPEIENMKYHENNPLSLLGAKRRELLLKNFENFL